MAAERKSAGAAVTECNSSIIDHAGDIKLFNNVPGYDVDSSIGDKSPSETVNNANQAKNRVDESNLMLKI